MIGDPTEGSILVAALKAGASAKALNHAYPREQEIPFDSIRKRMVTIHSLKNRRRKTFRPFPAKKRSGNGTLWQ